MDVEGHQDFKLKIYIYIFFFKKDKRKDTPTVKLFVFNRTYKTVFDSNSLWPTINCCHSAFTLPCWQFQHIFNLFFQLSTFFQ